MQIMLKKLFKIINIIPIIAIFILIYGCGNNNDSSPKNNNLSFSEPDKIVLQKNKNVSLPEPDKIIYGNIEITQNKEDILKLCFNKINLGHRVSFNDISSDEEPSVLKNKSVILEYNSPQILFIRYNDKFEINYKVEKIYVGFKDAASDVIFLQHPAKTEDNNKIVTTLFIDDVPENDKINIDLENIIKKL